MISRLEDREKFVSAAIENLDAAVSALVATVKYENANRFSDPSGKAIVADGDPLSNTGSPRLEVLDDRLARDVSELNELVRRVDALNSYLTGDESKEGSQSISSALGQASTHRNHYHGGLADAQLGLK